MDAFRKHASKFREQVAKQQQAVARQFSSVSYGSSQASDTIVTDEAELQRHLQLEKLYNSTRSGKHFQRDIVKGLDGLMSSGSRQTEVVNKLCEDFCKYASENPGARGLLGPASVHYGTNRPRIEREKEILYNNISTQVAEPLKAMVNGAPLEDARHLAQRYDRMRQDAEAQAVELARRQARSKETGGGNDAALKLQMAEFKMQEIASSMAVLGKEAAAALNTVDIQQQRVTFQRLIALVEAERAYHQRAAEILDQIEAQIVSERQRKDSVPPTQLKVAVVDTMARMSISEEPRLIGEHADLVQSVAGLALDKADRKPNLYLAEVMHAFDAESEGELSIAVGDFVVVRQVSQSGWSEGECKGKAGWFPSAYVKHRNQVPAGKLDEAF